MKSIFFVSLMLVSSSYFLKSFASTGLRLPAAAAQDEDDDGEEEREIEVKGEKKKVPTVSDIAYGTRIKFLNAFKLEKGEESTYLGELDDGEFCFVLMNPYFAKNLDEVEADKPFRYVESFQNHKLSDGKIISGISFSADGSKDARGVMAIYCVVKKLEKDEFKSFLAKHGIEIRFPEEKEQAERKKAAERKAEDARPTAYEVNIPVPATTQFTK